MSKSLDTTKKLSYEVYNGIIGETGTDEMSGSGYDNHSFSFVSFKSEGVSVTGTIRLDQGQLYGVDIDDYAGNYSGYMTFYSTIQASLIG